MLLQDMAPLPQLKRYGKRVGKDISFKDDTDLFLNSLHQKTTYLEITYNKLLCQTGGTTSN